MKISERNIIHERANYWVMDCGDGYMVLRAGTTHSVSDSKYRHDDDGRSLAIARCDYMARKCSCAERDYGLCLNCR